MLSTIFKTKPVIDEVSKAWIFDTFSWCITALDKDFFEHNSELILPNNTFYPGSSNSIDEMADTIFSNTLKYTGLTKWPIKLVPAERFIQKPMPLLLLASTFRGESCNISYQTSHVEVVNPSIDIAFHASQLNQPQDFIAYLVQNQASILLSQHDANDTMNTNKVSPVNDKVALPQTIDLIACFMGFGVIFANTAYQFKGGCGSCNNRNLNRKPALPELETVYALALFCVIKSVEVKHVKKSLKSHLYKHFKQAYKEILGYLQQTDNPTHKQLTSIKR